MRPKFIPILFSIRSISTSRAHFTNKSEVRVRFAPSPTGFIHLGGLRAALYNYIFAKQNEGKFILRLEDTDQTRIVPGSAEDFEESLGWAGLKLDESPILGGNYGPYSQSARLELYKSMVDELLESGKAYKCFCSPERLDLLRKYQVRNREKPHYDRACMHLSPTEIEEKLEENNGVHVVRFAIVPGNTTFDDMIFGRVSIDLFESKESDPVIMKSDQYPTYHFANVVDDHAMEISHVLRGSEWLSSTPKHVQLYRAFNWNEPIFAHFPLITMKGGAKKLSKRHNESNLRYWRDGGYRPDALLNFLTSFGGGLPKSKQDSMECWKLEKLVKEFDFNSVVRHSASIDLDKLKHFNSNALVNAWSEDSDRIVEEFHTLIKRNNLPTDLGYEQLKIILGHFISRVTSLNDLLTTENVFVWSQPTLTFSLQDYQKFNTRQLVEEIIRLINDSDIADKSLIDLKLKEIAENLGIDKPLVMRFIRHILTNSKNGLPIYEIFQCLGKDRLLSYLNVGLKYAS